MLFKIAIGLLLISNVLSCSKENITKPNGFLNLRVQGQEEDIQWESIKGTWIDSLGNVELEASSYYFDRCKIQLQGVTRNGNISPLTLIQFYYTDGLDFQPYSISGTLTITEASAKAVKGTFNLYLDNNYNGVSGKRVTGDFGVFDKVY
ncbi:MAG TPA: hypothetical protein VMR70_16930 [Flavisolibacter sp.]|nr:hypothetical protein [Flavisolibacter sp.]